jgi:quercetin dioxygenase-like cupin family protein
MTRHHCLALSLWTLAVAAAVHAQPAPPAAAPQLGSDISRTDLQRHDLSAAGREVIQVRVDFGPGADAVRHSHPGEEIVYALEGSLEYRVDGRPPIRLEAGDVLFIAGGAIHAVSNVGSDRASELATYIVRKGEPLVALAR